MRWNTRSAPERSTRTAMPGYFASNDLAIFSATARSIDVYQTTLPSRFAASTRAGVTASAAGAAETTRVENAPAAASAEDLRKLRRVNFIGCTSGSTFCVQPSPLVREKRERSAPGEGLGRNSTVFDGLWGEDRRPRLANLLYFENLAVPGLDLVARLLDRGRVVLHGLDFPEWLATGLFLRPGMHRAQAAGIDDELLRLGRERVALEQPRGVRIRRRLEDRIRSDDQRRAFGRIDDLHRLARLLHLEQIVFVAVGHHGALAERKLLGRVGRGLHLHDALPGELLEEFPAKVALHLVGRRHDRARIARMRLDDLAGPFRIEQIGETLRRVFGFHQRRIVADDAQPDAEARELAVRVLVFGRVELRDVLRHVGLQDPVALPDDEMCCVRRVHHVDRANIAGILLSDALEHALGAGSLHAHRDAGIFRLERLGDLLGERQVD